MPEHSSTHVTVVEGISRRRASDSRQGRSTSPSIASSHSPPIAKPNNVRITSNWVSEPASPDSAVSSGPVLLAAFQQYADAGFDELVGDFLRKRPSQEFGAVLPSYTPGVRLGELCLIWTRIDVDQRIARPDDFADGSNAQRHDFAVHG